MAQCMATKTLLSWGKSELPCAKHRASDDLSCRSRPFKIQRLLVMDRKNLTVEVIVASLQIAAVFTSTIRFEEVKCPLLKTWIKYFLFIFGIERFFQDLVHP